MKRGLIILSFILALLLSGCGSVTPPAPAKVTPPVATQAPAPVITPEPTPEPVFTEQELEAQRLLGAQDFSVAVEKALEAVNKAPRDDLSTVTYPFEGEGWTGGPELDAVQQAYFDGAVDYIIENMPEDASAYDKYRYLAAVISYRCAYDYDNIGEVNLTPYGALVLNRGICLGYTNAMAYLCEKADLWCEKVSGFASWNHEEHGWDLVKLEDGTYYIDVTWCDQYGDPATAPWFDYFMLTETKLSEDHGTWNGGPATGLTVFGAPSALLP